MTYQQEDRMVDEAYVRALPWDGIVPLEQILTYALPAYGDGTWPEVLVAMYGDLPEQDIITTLTTELMADPDRLFQEPIRIYFTDPADWDADDERLYGPRPILPRVGNGMHRIAATAAAGGQWIRCTSQDWELKPPAFGGEIIQVSYRFHGVLAPSAGLPATADVDDLAFFWLRSFRLTEQVWAETDAMGSSNGIHECVYHCPHHLQAELLQAIQDRAGRHGVRLEVVSSRLTTWDELDAEIEAEVRTAGL